MFILHVIIYIFREGELSVLVFQNQLTGILGCLYSMLLFEYNQHLSQFMRDWNSLCQYTVSGHHRPARKCDLKDISLAGPSPPAIRSLL